jgi:peptidoglycan/xylan/chitin deacetylase (PgdA/CDA1 family)
MGKEQSMNELFWTAAVVSALCFAAGDVSARGAEPPGGSPRVTNPFFPYCVSVPDNVLQDLGYTPIHNLYTGIDLGQEPPFGPEMKDQIRRLKDTNTIFWLTIQGRRDQGLDDKAVAIVRELAAVADEAGVQIAIYPHSGFYVATAREALRVVKQVDRRNVGVTITLCHELMGDQGPELPQIIEEVAPHLFVVTVNGADKKEKGERIGWDRLIQPLGQGDCDVYRVLEKLRSVGFTGPIGLQCYGLQGDPLVHLKQSIEAWKAYAARLDQPPAKAR